MHPFDTARRQERDGITLLTAQREQAERQLLNDVSCLTPRQCVPAAVTLELLRGTATALLDPAPEHSRECLLGHTPPPEKIKSIKPLRTVAADV